MFRNKSVILNLFQDLLFMIGTDQKVSFRTVPLPIFEVITINKLS